MADIVHHLLESPAAATAAATTTNDGEGFTFAAVSRLSLPLASRCKKIARDRRRCLRTETRRTRIRRARPLGQLLLEERERGPSSPGRSLDDDGGELDQVPAETYCLWSPGASPAAAGSIQSPRARWEKSGSTGSVLRWRRRRLLGRSNSDGKDRFVYILNTISPDERNAKEGDGNGGRRPSSFFPCNKRDIVGLFANAAAFRRSYHPF